jgi:hypothetical protein
MSGEGTMRYTTKEQFSGQWRQGRWNGRGMHDVWRLYELECECECEEYDEFVIFDCCAIIIILFLCATGRYHVCASFTFIILLLYL